MVVSTGESKHHVLGAGMGIDATWSASSRNKMDLTWICNPNQNFFSL